MCRTLLDFCGSTVTAVSHRINRARKLVWNEYEFLTDNNLTLATRMRRYSTRIVPCLLWGCSSWSWSQSTCQSISSFENDCSRRFMEYDGDSRRIGWNVSDGLLGKAKYFTRILAMSLQVCAVSGQFSNWRRHQYHPGAQRWNVMPSKVQHSHGGTLHGGRNFRHQGRRRIRLTKTNGNMHRSTLGKGCGAMFLSTCVVWIGKKTLRKTSICLQHRLLNLQVRSTTHGARKEHMMDRQRVRKELFSMSLQYGERTAKS